MRAANHTQDRFGDSRSKVGISINGRNGSQVDLGRCNRQKQGIDIVYVGSYVGIEQYGQRQCSPRTSKQMEQILTKR